MVKVQVIAINGQYPGPIVSVTTNWNVVVNIKNNLDEPFLVTWYVLGFSLLCSSLMLLLNNISFFGLGMGCNKERTLGRMVFWEQIAPSLLVGIGHMSSRSKIRLGASFISLLSIFRELRVVMVELL